MEKKLLPLTAPFHLLLNQGLDSRFGQSTLFFFITFYGVSAARPSFMFPLLKTFQTIKKANLLGIMFLCAALAVAIVLTAVWGITWLSDTLVTLEKSWLDKLVTWTVGIATGIGGWFILPAFMVLIAGVFQEITIHRVEKTYYPERMRQQEPRFWSDIGHDIKFTIWALFLNILVLPLYFFGIGFLVSIALNSYLLGREFFESAAGYHLGKANARKLVPANRRLVYGGGFFITLITLVPLVNLFMPIFAIIWMVHAYHGIKTTK